MTLQRMEDVLDALQIFYCRESRSGEELLFTKRGRPQWQESLQAFAAKIQRMHEE